MTRTRSFAGILAGVVLAFAVHATAARAAELELSAPLPVDPNVRMVTLPNGLECWMRAHATPPERVGLWLHVGSGSINEEEDQRGLAHFLEHMAFQGSEHFPPGELVKYFESIGLTFGHHQNAFTSFDQTTYVLALPNTDDETVENGLLCLADFAFRLSLLPEQIDKERGVILEEIQARKGPGQRMFEQLLPAILPGSRVAERLPIGKEEVVRRAGREQFRRYYTTWYRPDNTVLMIVGDVDLDRVEGMVRAAFADWRPVPDAPADAPLGIVPYGETRAAVIADPEVTRADVSIVAVRPVEDMQTVGDFRRSLVDSIGRWIVNRRLGDMVREGTAPFQSASVHKSTLWNVCTYVEAEASGPPEKWREMLGALAVELKRAREHGFLEQELQDARKAILAAAEQDARTEGTRDARTLLREMNGLVSEGRKPISAAQGLELLTGLVDTVTLAEVGEAFRRDLDPNARLLLATVPEDEARPLPSREGLLAAAAEAEAEWVAPPVPRERALSLLEGEPEPGAVARQELEPDLLVLSATLTNGVRAHLRSMDFKKDEVLVRLVLAGGALWETSGSRGLTEVAALAFRQPATSRLSSTDVRDLLTGKNVKLGGGADQDCLVIEFGGTPEDIETGFRLAHALLTDPVVEPSALEVWKESTRQEIERRRTDVRDRLGEAADDLLTGGDLRFRPLTAAQVEGLTARDGQRWLERIVRSAPIEAAVVGDIARERALELVLKYLGSLPGREAVGPLWADLRRVFPRSGPLSATVEVDTITATSAVLVGWRGADWTAVKDRRCLQIAAQIVTTRLREELRESRGLAYSPYCSGRPARGYPGTGLFASYLAGDPAHAREAAELMRGVMERFAREGPTEQEMETVRKQFANRIETEQKEPRYWLSVLAELDYRGTRLADVKEVLEKYTTYTRVDLARVVRRHLKDARRIEVTARPR